MNNLQSKVNVQNSQAVKNARRLYIGGFPPGSSEVSAFHNKLILDELNEKEGMSEAFYKYTCSMFSMHIHSSYSSIVSLHP